MNKILLGLIASSFLVYANVTVISDTYQEVKVKDKLIWTKVNKVLPETTIKFVNKLKNFKKADAIDLVISNEIPEYLSYIENSATCGESCSITFSINNGQTFNLPEKLYIKEKGMKKKQATGSDYTNIRWEVSLLEGKSEKLLEYRAIVNKK